MSWLEREEPDYWIVHSPLWPFEHPAASQPWFRRAYQPVMETPPIDGREALVVYERVVPIAEAKAFLPDA